MKIGKVSENVLKRTVLKGIKNTREEVLIGAGQGEDCAVLELKEDEVDPKDLDNTIIFDEIASIDNISIEMDNG